MNAKTKQEAVYYNKKVYEGSFGEKYDSVNSIKEFRGKLMLKDLRLIFSKFSSDDLNLLDIGCGTGYLCLNYYKFTKKSKVHCLDISKKMLDILKSKLSKEDIKRTSFENKEVLEYLDKTKIKFDIIGVSGALHHFFDYPEVIDASLKRIKKSGFFYMEVEPLNLNKLNFIKRNMIKIYGTLDYSILMFKEKLLSPLKLIPYFFYAFFKSMPLIPKTSLEKLKNKIFKFPDGLNHEDIEKSETIKEGLDLGKIREILNKNNFEILLLEGGPSSNFLLTHKIINFFNINDHFKIIARKT